MMFSFTLSGAKLCLSVFHVAVGAAPDTLIRPHDNLPADSLAMSLQGIWEVVRSQKDLNLPAHKVTRCDDVVTCYLSLQGRVAMHGNGCLSVNVLLCGEVFMTGGALLCGRT
jgi:Root hair defective 3 GTP-binding protein (RHD3)